MDLGNLANLAGNMGDSLGNLGELQKLASDREKLVELFTEFNAQNPDIAKKIIETINISGISDLKNIDAMDLASKVAANKEITQPFVDFAKSKLG